MPDPFTRRADAQGNIEPATEYTDRPARPSVEALLAKLPKFSLEEFVKKLRPIKERPDVWALSRLQDRIEQSRNLEDFQTLLWFSLPPIDKKYNGRIHADSYAKKFRDTKPRDRDVFDFDYRAEGDYGTPIWASARRFLGKNQELRPAACQLYYDHLIDTYQSTVEFANQTPELDDPMLYAEVMTDFLVHGSIAEDVETALGWIHESGLQPEEARRLMDSMFQVWQKGLFIRGAEHFKFMARFDPEYAIAHCMKRLAEPDTMTPSERYAVTAALAYLDTGEKKPVIAGEATVAGLQVAIEGGADAATTQRLSVYGEYGVTNTDGAQDRIFSIHDIEQTIGKGFRVIARELGYDDLFFSTAEASVPVNEKQDVLNAFMRDYEFWSNHELFAESGIRISALSLREQAAAIRLLIHNDQHVADLKKYGKRGGVFVFRTALLELSYTGSMEQTKQTWWDTQQYYGAHRFEQTIYFDYQINSDPFQKTVEFYDTIESRAGVFMQHVASDTSLELDLRTDDIIRGLLAGYLRMVSDAGKKQFSEAAYLGMAYFQEIVEGGQHTESINLDQYVIRERALQQLIKIPEVKRVIVETLAEAKLLKPVPELHWRVDRTHVEYVRRLGVDPTKLVQGYATVLELGPGSGIAKQERKALYQQTGAVHEFSIADAYYYNPSRAIESLIRFDAIEKSLGISLSPEDKKDVADVLGVMLLVAEGYEASPQIIYAAERIATLTNNPKEIANLVIEQCVRLRDVTRIPTGRSTHDTNGVVSYIEHTTLGYLSHAAQATLQELQNRAQEFVKTDNPINALPLHPEGMLLGDLEMVGKITSNSVDVAMGVRSSVYKRGEDWIKLGTDVARALKPGGVWVDDSIRDNDGHRYRLEELQQLRSALAGQDISLGVIYGPGFLGEDYVEGEEVPLALVMSKGVLVEQRVGALIEPGFELRSV